MLDRKIMYQFWLNPYINTPAYCLLVVFVDEIILRQNPHWAFAVTIYGLCCIPFGALFFWEKEIVLFSTIKMILVSIPVLTIVLFRIATVSVNTNPNIALADNHDEINSNTIANTPSQFTYISIEDDPNIRFFEMKRVYYHCLLPSKLIICLRKHLVNKKMHYYFNIFCYIIICVNIFEAVLLLTNNYQTRRFLCKTVYRVMQT